MEQSKGCKVDKKLRRVLQISNVSVEFDTKTVDYESHDSIGWSHGKYHVSTLYTQSTMLFCFSMI